MQHWMTSKNNSFFNVLSFVTSWTLVLNWRLNDQLILAKVPILFSQSVEIPEIELDDM